MPVARYIAFDVETPNRFNSRMSAIGIAVVEDGRIVDSFYSLVDPEQPFDWFNTQLTGIDSEAVAGAPTFSELWPRIEPVMSSGVLVAHNASFDMGVLKKCLRDYGIPWRPRVKGLCTVLMGRRLMPGVSHRWAICVPITGSTSTTTGPTATAWPAPRSCSGIWKAGRTPGST